MQRRIAYHTQLPTHSLTLNMIHLIAYLKIMFCYCCCMGVSGVIYSSPSSTMGVAVGKTPRFDRYEPSQFSVRILVSHLSTASMVRKRMWINVAKGQAREGNRPSDLTHCVAEVVSEWVDSFFSLFGCVYLFGCKCGCPCSPSCLLASPRSTTAYGTQDGVHYYPSPLLNGHFSPKATWCLECKSCHLSPWLILHPFYV